MIYGVPDDVNNDRMQKKVVNLLKVDVRVVVCPPSVRELYRMPFLTDEDGGRHFGVAGIERFISRQLVVRFYPLDRSNNNEVR